MKRIKIPPAESLTTPIQAIRRRPARIVSYEPGSVWSLNASRVVVIAQVSTTLVRVRHTADDKLEAVPIDSLDPWVAQEGTSEAIHDHADHGNHSAQVQSRAQLEFSVVASLVNSGDLSRQAKLRAANTLGISPRHLRTKIQRYLDLGTPEAFLPQRTGPRRGTSTLHPRVERLIAEIIVRELRLSADIACADLYPIIEADALALGLRPPGIATVSRRLQRERRKVRQLPAAIGNELAYRNAPVAGALVSAGALNVVEMDHTTCDVHIEHPELLCPIGRPILSLLIDWKTRVILGMCLTLEAPSRLTVGLCMHHGVFPKHQWLSDLGIPDACWPGFGLPTILCTDNASEFDAESQRRAAQRYGIELRFRPPGDPAAGGIIERAIGTMMGKVRLIPGESYSKALGQKPRHTEKRARFTLRDLELYLAREISMYHKRTHSGIGMPPLTAWERAWMVNGTPCTPRIPDCAETFRITFLPGAWRTVTREGLELNSFRYQSPDLAPFIERHKRRMVRWDPRDLSYVFLETRDHYIRVPWVESGLAPISIWEWRELRTQRIRMGKPRDREQIALEARANRELVARKAHDKKQWRAARRMAREKEWRRSRKVIPIVSRTVKGEGKADQPLQCRVED